MQRRETVPNELRTASDEATRQVDDIHYAIFLSEMEGRCYRGHDVRLLRQLWRSARLEVVVKTKKLRSMNI